MIRTVVEYVSKEGLEYDYDSDYTQIRDHIDSLTAAFEESDEAQGLPSANSTATFFCDMLFIYEGVTLGDCQLSELRETIENTIPRKMTLHDQSEAEEFIVELIQFWTFLDHTYKHPTAGKAVAYLEAIKDEFVKWMFDPQKAGMAKSIFTGSPGGIPEFESEEDLAEFINQYNQSIDNTQSNLIPFPSVRTAPKVGRNDKCPCGSGKKYKKCCGATK